MYSIAVLAAGQGSAAILQTAIFCPSVATAVITFSTAGTGVLTVGGAVVGVDEVYAGLFESEVTAVVCGARFPAEIYTRGFHWIPRMFTSIKHACD